jgi:small-conductance mechanosensitive channel
MTRSNVPWFALLAALLAFGCPQARAQAPAAEVAEAAPGPYLAETRASRAKLESFKLELEQSEAALGSRDLADADLQRLRQQIDPVSASLQELVDEIAPKLDAAKARLDQLGPKPKDGEPAEGADVERERDERETAAAEIGETLRLARTLQVQAAQVTTQIVDRRRAVFARALFQRSSGLLSPELWASVARSLPRDALALRIVSAGWLDLVRREATPGRLLLLGLALGAAIALYIGRSHLAPRLIARDPGAVKPSRRRRTLAAAAVLLLGALPAAGGSYVVYAILDVTNLVPPRIRPVMAALLGGLAFVAFIGALTDALFAPGQGAWRLVNLNERSAARATRFLVTIAAVIAVGKVVEALNHAIAAGLAATVATRGIFALLEALLLAELLRRFAVRVTEEEKGLGPYVSGAREFGGPVRLLGWIAVAAVLASVLGGYVALASFLVDQIVWIGVVLGLLLLGIMLADEAIGGTLRRETRVATTLQANTGLRKRSLEQIGVLASGIARVVLILVAILLVLAPWGVESADVLTSLRAAFFGVRVGDVTISVSTVVIGLLIFALGFAITRIVQRWLDTTFLPATDLDAGLRNSIHTAFGYLGVIVAGAIAFSYLGLSLDRIAIVAGALSVGIGFGLQSIVNNFVSGLILLWERPIRVGDLVVVGDGEGLVRRINVRATEIETFDRSTIIVPNSNLISGIVRNRVRGDRIGRVIVSVPVPRDSDPDRIAGVMADAAQAHPEVMPTPPPRVLFKRIGEISIEFDLVCFVEEVDVAARVSSELTFAIFRQLRASSLDPPSGAGPEQWPSGAAP